MEMGEAVEGDSGGFRDFRPLKISSRVGGDVLVAKLAMGLDVTAADVVVA